MRIGLDIGSTTLKCVVLDDENKIIFKEYKRHYSQITEKTAEMLKSIKEAFPKETDVKLSISGSAGMGFATQCEIPFVQEVYATRVAINTMLPDTDVVIELGGEDAKILFLTDGMEVRMNGSCAGGTGAFVDQMATLLDSTPGDMNELAKSYDKIYTIASRCGVFAKSDIQPLLNQGAKKNDISASIFAAVVNQTIGGLAQGRTIEGNVVYLGGPLTFLSELRASFDRILKINGCCPENSLYFVALGAALVPNNKLMNIDETIEMIGQYTSTNDYHSCAPLFKDTNEYDEFQKRHAINCIPTYDDEAQPEKIYIGIDAGSTTVKAVVIDENQNIVYSEYMQSNGNPISIIRDFLMRVRIRYPEATIASSAATGYGEEIIRNAFGVDFGIVETIAHFIAAKKFRPNVDFIIDIGGQDIKCFKIHNGAIENIFLNEACSSGCGSFLQTFAGALGYSISEFAQRGIFADKPVDLGSRCTVFMNSSVKQAQKDGASIANISAGLSISVVKNALYKVIRASNADSLGQNIVVQGGTFLNDAVLRAFEQEIQRDVVRPNIAGLMGAYGAALYSMKQAKSDSTVLTLDQLRNFTHEVSTIVCKGCTNNCHLTVNTFDSGRKFISGNRCEKPLAKGTNAPKYDLYDYKLGLLNEYKGVKSERGTIGIPMGLNMYELLPFWHRFFTELKFEVITSPSSNRALYLRGQDTIPSDTVCFPAKLIHGHIDALIEKEPDAIFYPCMTYNFDDGISDNHYNCPVVAYYPEVIAANVGKIRDIKFIYDYVGPHRTKEFPAKMQKILKKYFAEIPLGEIKSAFKKALNEYESYMNKIRDKGAEFIEIAEKNNQPIIVLSGRPYHLDPEVNHGINKLICECGAVLITEDSISWRVEKFKTDVLNQWTYHSRLYAAAKYITDKPNFNLVQLVSFGCGVDAVTTDEVRRILEESGKIYTQIKIDEITNLGAVKIRLRSLFAALEMGRE